ncbi:MAG: hypothetical protein GWO79_00975, partial [Actinobacteria bacterium]|nr:hypothetical protein [Actinomycetota bacterium]
NNLYTGNGANVGPGGIKSDGVIQGSSLEILNFLISNPTDSPGTCDADMRGAMYYDATNKAPCYCDGSTWGQFNNHTTGC